MGWALSSSNSVGLRLACAQNLSQVTESQLILVWQLHTNNDPLLFTFLLRVRILELLLKMADWVSSLDTSGVSAAMACLEVTFCFTDT